MRAGGTGAAGKRRAMVFASLYTLESTIRALVASVIPITAYELLQSEQRVSVLYTLVSIVSLCGTLMVPMLIGWIARRRVYSLGVIVFAIGSMLMATYSIEGLGIGMAMRVVANSCVSVVLSLYIMDTIPKTELVGAESVRLTLSTFAWVIGPTAGSWIYATYGLVGGTWRGGFCGCAAARAVLVLPAGRGRGYPCGKAAAGQSAQEFAPVFRPATLAACMADCVFALGILDDIFCLWTDIAGGIGAGQDGRRAVLVGG